MHLFFSSVVVQLFLLNQVRTDQVSLVWAHKELLSKCVIKLCTIKKTDDKILINSCLVIR